MPSLLFPGAQRPSTAVNGIGDVHDDNVYSALVVAHGGVGTVKTFVSGQGSPIPTLTGTAITAANLPAHYLNYSPTTTIIEQSGQLGNSVGDATIRAIGVTLDLAAYSTAGVPRVFGATSFEVKDVLSKCRLEIKVSNKRRIVGPVWAYPQTGGASGFSVGTGETIPSNGFPTGRKLRSPIEIARTDVIVGEFTADAALAFSDVSFATTHVGQATLVWINMIGTMRSDVR
jgi:hypothetical protein